MDNIQDKIESKMSKVKSEIGKGKVDFLKEKNTINREINKVEDKKSKLLLDMGVLLYSKIRNKEIIDTDFDNLCECILEQDKIIYEHLKKIEKLNLSMKKFVCECGNVIDSNAKFCGECGKKVVDNEEEKEYIVCKRCDFKIDVDSKFCTCCGNKIN